MTNKRTPDKALTEATERACKEPTLLDALAWICIWESERVVKQARKNPQWETCFKVCLQSVFSNYPKDRPKEKICFRVSECGYSSCSHYKTHIKSEELCRQFCSNPCPCTTCQREVSSPDKKGFPRVYLESLARGKIEGVLEAWEDTGKDYVVRNSYAGIAHELIAILDPDQIRKQERKEIGQYIHDYSDRIWDINQQPRATVRIADIEKLRSGQSLKGK